MWQLRARRFSHSESDCPTEMLDRRVRLGIMALIRFVRWQQRYDHLAGSFTKTPRALLRRDSFLFLSTRHARTVISKVPPVARARTHYSHDSNSESGAAFCRASF